MGGREGLQARNQEDHIHHSVSSVCHQGLRERGPWQQEVQVVLGDVGTSAGQDLGEREGRAGGGGWNMMAALKIKTGPVLMNIPCPVIWGLVFFPPHLTGKGLKGEAGAYRNPRLQQRCSVDITFLCVVPAC